MWFVDIIPILFSLVRLCTQDMCTILYIVLYNVGCFACTVSI